MGSAFAVHPRIDRGTGGQDHRVDDHHHYRSVAGLRRHLGRRTAPDPVRVRPVDRVRGVQFLPVVLLFRWRSEEHTSELQSLMLISSSVFFLKNTTISHHMYVIVWHAAV